MKIQLRRIQIKYGVSSSLSNTAYSVQLINTAYPLPLDMAYRLSRTESEIIDFDKGEGKVAVWEELVEKFFCKFYPDSYDGEDEIGLKEQALRSKAIMEGLISDDESSNDGWRRWESHEITYHDHDEIEYENETHDERQDLCKARELPVCNMRRFKMIKYSFGQDEGYVVVKEDEYDDLVKTSDDACRVYQEIFRMMD
ncbi:hypothetical protein Tco_0296091 [Tanacetum coccineum]